jgi:tape measure domain-containing protein
MTVFELVAKLTLDSSEYEDSIKKTQNAAESFGQKIKSGFGFGVLMRAGQKAFDAIGNAISSNLAGATKRFDTLQNFPKVMESLGYTADSAKASMDMLASSIDHLPTTLDAVASQTQSVVAVTGDLQKATELTLALNNAMASGGAPAEQQASAINQWVQAMAKGKPDMQDWRSLVQTAPAQMDQLSKSLLGATANQSDLYEAMKDGTVSIDQVNDAMINLSKNGGDGFASWTEQAKSAGAGINMALTNIKAGIQRNIANVLDSLDTKLESVGGLSGVLQSVVTPINAIGDSISKVISGEMSFDEAMGSLFDSIASKVPQFINKGLEMVLNLAIGIAQGLPQLIVKGLDAITNFINGLGQGNGELASKAIELIGTLVGGLIENAPQILMAGLRLMVALLNGIVKGFAAIPPKLVSLAKKIPTAIKNGVGSLASIGRNMIEGLWGGIKSKFDNVIDRVKNLASKLPKAVKKVLGISSPSKVFMELGKWIPEGLALGIERNVGSVQDAMDTMSGATEFTPADNSMEFGNGGNAIYDLINALSSMRVEVVSQIDGKEVARITAPIMSDELNRLEMRASRKLGYV